MKTKEITDKEMEKAINALVLSIKLIRPNFTDQQAKNALENAGVYLARKRLLTKPIK